MTGAKFRTKFLRKYSPLGLTLPSTLLQDMAAKPKLEVKSFIVGLSLALILLVSATGGAIADRLFGIKPLDYFFPRTGAPTAKTQVVSEESVVIDAVDQAGPSVVTVSVQTPQRKVIQFNPFGGGFSSQIQGGDQQDIGSGFVVRQGLVVTNKHVVADEALAYKVVTQDGAEHEVTQISRDPANDVAILKVDGIDEVPAIKLGSSEDLKVGQFVIAIGTSLGEFRHSVTTGVISGLGRGITAGSAFEGFVERLDDVIQTDAAINPGNSGGPLLNSSGEVIGINVAVAQGAQNVAFAIPISVVTSGLTQFEANGKFASKPFLGVQYQMISAANAILNEVPRGAFVVDVVPGSPAEKAGVVVNDIITKFDGKNVSDEGDLAGLIAAKKPGDKVEIELWRSGKSQTLSVTLSESDN